MPAGHPAHRGVPHQARVPRGPAGHVAVAAAAEGKGGTGGNQGSAWPPARPLLSVLGYGAALLAATCGARGRAQPRACRDRAAELVAGSGCLLSPHRLLQALVKKKTSLT